MSVDVEKIVAFKEEVQTRNRSVDVLRVVAATLVICMHAGVNDEIRIVSPVIGCFFDSICRLAVPYFFCVSGYYLYNKSRFKQAQNSLKSASRLFKYFIIALVLAAFWHTFNGDGSIDDAIVWKDQLTEMFYFGYPILNGSLWFFIALILASLVVYLNARFIQKDWLMLTIGVLFYIYGVLVCSYFNFLGIERHDVLESINFLCFALAFVFIGFLMSKYKKTLLGLSKNIVGLTLFLSILISFGEFYLIYLTNQTTLPDTTFLLLFVAPLIVLFAHFFPIQISNKHNKERKVFNFIAPFLGKFSLFVYIFHLIVLSALSLYFPTLFQGLSPVAICFLEVGLTFLVVLFIFLISQLVLFLIKKLPRLEQKGVDNEKIIN
jgi:surface polysaccharide O-acyltransferase-like enzyme